LILGECRASIDCISQPDGELDVDMKAEDNRYKDKSRIDCAKDEKEKFLEKAVDICKATTEGMKLLDDCNLIVELPPEGQQPDEVSPSSIHNNPQPDSGGAQQGVVQSGILQSGGTQCGILQSGVAQSGGGQSGAAQPSVAQSGVAQSGAAQFLGAQSGVAHPGGAQSGVAQIGVAQSGGAQSGFFRKGREACKAANETPNGNQDEWSYTVYDIDGGSKVTDQDLSHVMQSIKTAIDQTSDHHMCTSANDSKILKIKVAVGAKESSQPKCKPRRHKEISRMILPPPDSEEAELLCYYIREKLLKFANQEEASDQGGCRERKRGRRRNRGGSIERGSRSPEVTCELDGKREHPVVGISGSALQKEKTDCTNSGSKQRRQCSLEYHQDDVSRPLYGLPQREDTYGGPVDSPVDQCAIAAKRSVCPPSSGTRSPQDSCLGLRRWPHHVNEHENERCAWDASTRLSSFQHKDAYRETRKNGSPRKNKKQGRKEQFSNFKHETIVNNVYKPLGSQQDAEHPKVCPCKYRGRRISKQKRLNKDNSVEENLANDLQISEETSFTQNDTILCDENQAVDDLLSRDDVHSSDGTASRDDLEHKLEHPCRKESRSSAESRSDDGNIGSHERPSQPCADAVFYNGVRWREGRKLCGDSVVAFEAKRKDATIQTSAGCSEVTRPCDDVRPRDGCKWPENTTSRDAYKHFDGPKSRDEYPLDASSGTSNEDSHSSSWRDQSALTGHDYSTIHEWNSGEELTTEKMIRKMQNQGLHYCSGNHSPRSADSSIGSPKSEIVHKHEHHHYHYHIFKRS